MKATDFFNVSKRPVWIAVLRAESRTFTVLEVKSLDMIPFKTSALRNVTIVQGESGDQVHGFIHDHFPDYGEVLRKEIT